jgi:two-component system, LuxR family, response regulator FixJ
MSGQVHIVDDDEPVRESLAYLCLTGGLQALTYGSPQALLEATPALREGCIVTDVRMPQMDGLTLIAKLHERGVQLPMVVITGHGDVAMAVAAMKAGAVDFLEKPFDDEIFLTTVRDAVARSERGAAPRMAGADGLDGKLALLSERERQVLDRLIEGEANKVIALNLGISPRTVEIYRAKVMTKMEASSFADLIRTVVAGRSA